jgi:hypothetical protein
MDDVDAAIQALEWGKNEFLGNSNSPSSLNSSSRTPSAQLQKQQQQQQQQQQQPSLESSRLQMELSRTRVDLEATKRRCHELQTDRDIQRQGRAQTERDLLSSRTTQTEQTSQLHSEIRSLQQQLWQSKQEAEHWRAKDHQSQVELSASQLSIEQLRSRLATYDRDHTESLRVTQRKLEQALAERDAAVLETRQLKMGTGGTGSKGGGTTGGGSEKVDDDLDVDSLPQQVAQRLRQAAEANVELVRKLNNAENNAEQLRLTMKDLENRETQLHVFENALQRALSQPRGGGGYEIPTQTFATSTTSTTSINSSPNYGVGVGGERGVALARRAEVVASSASNMLHLLTSKHGALLSHVSELRSQLDQSQARLTRMDSEHLSEMEGMDRAHSKILARLSDMSTEASGISSAVKRSKAVVVERAVAEVVDVLAKEREKRRVAETKMKSWRERVNEWEVVVGETEDDKSEAMRLVEKMKLKNEKLKEVLKRAKIRIVKLEADREQLRTAVKTNRWREVQLAEQAATQAEIQVSCFMFVVVASVFSFFKFFAQ